MRRKHLFAALTAMLLLPALSADAQTSGGSSYSVFNLGDLRTITTAAGIGRGNVEVATFSPRSVNSTNPAMWGDLENVTIQAGLVFSQAKVSDPGGSIAQNRVGLQNFSAGFPLSSSFRATLVAGLRPYSTVNYRTRIGGKAPTAAGDSVESKTTFVGFGGLSEAIFGTSFAPIPEVTLGLAASRYFGTVNNTTSVEFPGEELNPATYDRNDLFGAWGFRTGVLARPIPELGIGFVFEAPVDLERERQAITSYSEQEERVVDTSSVVTSTIALPSRITVGASWGTGRFLLATQAMMQAWDGGTFANARNALRIGAGLDRLGSDAAGARGIDRWTLRLGGFYDQTYYSVNGRGIDEYGITFGAGIPLIAVTGLDVGTLLDLGVELGRRGAAEEGLTEELFGRVSIELAVSEIWFVRSRR